MKIRLAEEWLHTCSGCEIAILNTGGGLLELLEQIDIVHMPLLMDHKLASSPDETEQMAIPEADIGIISGGVANEEHLAVLLEMRKQCTTLIALGTCAGHGGIPAMANQWSTEQCLTTVFSTPSTDSCTIPDQGVPGCLDRVYAADEKITVDILIPGCPPDPGTIKHVLTALIQDTELQLPSKSVCDTCPARREGESKTADIRRFVDNADFQPDKPLNSMRCLLEQGLICMGPVTAAGCAHHGAPRCIAARVPCRGCFGPVRRQGNQLIDMMNALASNGIDFKSVVDRKSILRFSGAHGRIRNTKM